MIKTRYAHPSLRKFGWAKAFEFAGVEPNDQFRSFEPNLRSIGIPNPAERPFTRYDVISVFGMHEGDANNPWFGLFELTGNRIGYVQCFPCLGWGWLAGGMAVTSRNMQLLLPTIPPMAKKDMGLLGREEEARIIDLTKYFPLPFNTASFSGPEVETKTPEGKAYAGRIVDRAGT